MPSKISLYLAGCLLAGYAWTAGAESTWDQETPALSAPVKITVYRSPTCGCCKQWLSHVAKHGFTVEDVVSDDMKAVKQRLGISDQLSSCHTALVDGYLIEGHVPAGDIKKLLAEKPAVAGLTVPGMPMGTPGMDMGGRKDAFSVMSFDKAGNPALFHEYSGN